MIERWKRLKPAALILAFVVFATTWIDFSRFHNEQHSDALIPVLVSLQRWTPFYWAQDRYGMCWPWIAQVFRSPFVNLIVQNGITVALGLVAFGLLADYLLPRGKDWVPAAVIAWVVFVSLVAPNERFDIVSGCQPYGPSIALALIGLGVLREGQPGPLIVRTLLALPCLAIAEWINVGAILPLAPLAAIRLVLDVKDTRDWKSARGAAIGVLALYAATKASLYLSSSVDHEGLQQTVQTWAPSTEWLVRSREWSHAVWQRMGTHAWEIGASSLAAFGLLTMVIRAVRAQGWGRVVAGLGLALAAAFTFFVMGLTDWVRGNGYALRYALAPILLSAVAFGQLAAIPFDSLGQYSKFFRPVAAAIVLVTIALIYGAPGYSKVEAAFDARWGVAAREVVDAEATHVAGDYWRVWPIVFRANWLHFERGDGKQVYGLAHRAEATFAESRAVPVDRIRVAVSHDDRALGYLGVLQQPGWALLARGAAIDVIVPRGADAQTK